MRPLNFFSGASTGTFSCLKVAMMLLLAASMVGSPAALATKASVRAIELSSGRLGVMAFSLPFLRTSPGEHAFERRIAIEKVVLERGGRVEHDYAKPRPGERPVHLHQYVGQRLVLRHQVRQLP